MLCDAKKVEKKIIWRQGSLGHVPGNRSRELLICVGPRTRQQARVGSHGQQVAQVLYRAVFGRRIGSYYCASLLICY